MDLVFHLSGEHKTLPKSEVVSLLEHHHILREVLIDLDQVLVCRVERCDPSLLERLGMTHAVLEYLGSCPAEIDKIRFLAEGIGHVGESFSVRVKRIKLHSKHLSALELERIVGGSIKGDKVDLKTPRIHINAFLTSDAFVMGKLFLGIKRSLLEKRNPKHRPFFHPSSLMPKLSRTLCNICGVMEGVRLLDPFCGAGGLLIEAGLLGAEVFGIDIDEQMVLGSRRNLSYYGVKGSVELGDATNLKLDGLFDVVLTDPPYGRSSTTKGMDLGVLYSKAASSIFRALKKNGAACMISPEDVRLEEIALKAGFEVAEVHHVRVHRSLTRKIAVFKKP